MSTVEPQAGDFHYVEYGEREASPLVPLHGIIRRVPRGQVAADGCDLSVGDADGPADSLAAGDDVRVLNAGALVERKDPALILCRILRQSVSETGN